MYQRSITAVQTFLQYVWMHHRTKYDLFLACTNDPWQPSRLFNDLYRAVWVGFKEKVLTTTLRKCKYNELKPVTVYNCISKKNGTEGLSFIKRLHASSGLTTTQKEKMEWSYKLPALNFAEDSSISPLAIDGAVQLLLLHRQIHLLVLFKAFVSIVY